MTSLTAIIVNSNTSNKSTKILHFLLVSKIVLNMLVSFQNHLICSTEPVSKLTNEFIEKGNLKLIVLQDTSYCIARYSLKSISTFSASWNASLEALALYSIGESEEKDIGSDPKISTVLRVTISKLSFKKVSSLKLSVIFTISISKEKAYNIM